MKLKRMIGILLCFTMVLGSLTACGNGNKDSKSETDTKGVTNETEDKGSADVKTSNINKTGFPIVNEPITLKIFGQQGPVQAEWPTMDLFTEYQSMTGINLEFDVVPSQGYDEKKSLLFASNEYPDIFVRAALSNTEIVKYGAMGVLAPLEDLIAEYAPNYAKHLQDYPAILSRITAPDGHIYALSDIITLNAARTDKFWINKAWLDQIGKEVPTTVEELEDVLRAFQSVDFNGNGQADEVPLGVADLTGLMNNLSGVWGFQRQFGQNLQVVDGKVETWITNDGFKDMLMWMNQMYTEGLLDPEIFTQDYAKYASKMSGQLMGMFFNQADDTFDSSNFVGIAPFAGKSDTQYVSSQPVARGNGVFAISADCENKEAAMRWVDYFYGEEGSTFLRFGVDGKTMTFDAAGKPQYVDGILNSPDGSGTAIGQFTIWPGGGAPQWLNDNNSIAVASERTKAAQVALDPYLPENIYAEPLFEQEVNDRLAVLQTDITTYLKEATAKFVRGDLSFDNWDTYVSTLEKIGIEEWVGIYQTAYDALQ
jgi:putative aldouronate transport system substrate-binding protein